MSTVETPVATLADWERAETLVVARVKTLPQIRQPYVLYRLAHTPFLFQGNWEGPPDHLLVYDGKIQSTAGLTAFAPYLASLGVARLKAIPIGNFENLLGFFGVRSPRKDIGGAWTSDRNLVDLNAGMEEVGGVLRYQAHFRVLETLPFSPFGPGSMIPGAPMRFERWSLQLHPVPPYLDWKFQAHVERPQTNQ